MPAKILWQVKPKFFRRKPHQPHCRSFTDFHDNQKDAGIVEDKFAYIATLEEIKENDYNLNIPRYVDTYEEEAEIDLTEVQKKLHNCKTNWQKYKTNG